jgi:hypothetical protein
MRSSSDRSLDAVSLGYRKAKAALIVLGACLLSTSLAPAAKAADITLTLPEFNGTSHSVLETYPLPPVTVGTFNYTIPAGDKIVSADINGTFGNSVVAGSAGVDLFLNGLLVGQNIKSGPGFTMNEPWSHTFTPAEFSALASGTATLTATQTSEFVIRLGVTTLDIHTVVPEPSSLALLTTGGLPLLAFRRRRKQR